MIKMKLKKPDKEQKYYRATLVCKNCDKEKYVRIEKNTSITWFLFFCTEKCRNCGCSSFRKGLFQ